MNAFDKRFRFFPPVEWRQAYSTRGRKGDLTDFQRAKGLRYLQFAMPFCRFINGLKGHKSLYFVAPLSALGSNLIPGPMVVEMATLFR
jgi:hypothetical protein